MSSILSRALRSALVPLLGISLVSVAVAQRPKPAPARPAAQASVPWLYRGSDIPVDRNWTFGELANGLRYAVRNNGVPPGQVSIRVAIDAGSLHERDDEQGFAHFLEHLSFRGSKYVADGEAKRVWQRLGATFGSDSNAATTPTQTIYRLDLPNASPQGLDESLKILSGMMSGPSISPAEVDTERRTVLAEAREQEGPQQRVGDATRQLFFAGQMLSKRAPIGTTASLTAATAQSVRAFHDRWYRPARTVISISGDGDPRQFAQLIEKHFGGWRGVGPDPADPDFGAPAANSPSSRYLVETGVPVFVNMAVVRPWKPRADTIVYNQGKLIDLVATRVINRRLEQRARAGGSYLGAEVQTEDVARSVDGTFVSIVPIGNDWKTALADVRAVIADALANPPTPGEIERETGEFTAALDVAVETARAEASAKQADDIIEAVNIRETVASPEVARDVFAAMKGKISPADILTSTRKIFAGAGPRVLVTSPTPSATGEADLAAALAAPVKALVSTQTQAPVSFDALPKLGPPGTLIKRGTIEGLGFETAEFSNGVKLIFNSTRAEAGRIYVTARFGGGRQALPRDRATVAWAAGPALVASGIGTLGQDALDRLTSGRQINLGFEIADDAFALRASTRSADLADQLRLIATKLARPGWDAAPVVRTRAGFLIGLDTQDASPQGVLARDLNGLLRGGDKRWASPGRADVDALTPQSFRALWEPLLAAGPVELLIFGDFETEAMLKAVGETFGALASRPAVRAVAGSDTSNGPAPTAQPVRKFHRGAPDQAAAVLAWATGGGIDGVFESRVLDVMAQIFSDRLFEQFREGEGAAYSPDVSSNWPVALKGGGSFVVSSQVKPQSVDAFFTRARAIAADLVANPVSADELARALGPMQQQLQRASSGNSFWMNQLAGSSRDPRKIAALKSWPGDMRRISALDIQASAKRYLLPGKSFSMVVLPAKK